MEGDAGVLGHARRDFFFPHDDTPLLVRCLADLSLS
jgi:hypothetical protein